MFKLNNYAVTLALLTHAGSRTASAACDGVISTFVGECTLANFAAALSPDCDINVLFSDVAAGVTTIDEEIADLCAYDAPVQFVEIQGTYQRDRRYFAGGGPLVDGGDWAIDSARVARFNTNKGSDALISWPEYAARVQYNIDNGLGTNGYPANMNLETSCALKTAMCCFTEGDFATNGDGTTDVCRHDLYDSPQSNHIKDGWSVFPGSETPAHCVGFTWTDATTDLIGNMMYDVSLATSVTKGYLKGVPGAPMCGCVEHMPVVETAKCRTASKAGAVTYTFAYDSTAEVPYVTADNAVDITYADCANPDLAGQYKDNQATDAEMALIDAHLVGAGGCSDELIEYLNDKQFLHQGQHPTKYVTPDEAQWSELFVGEGIYFQPPAIDPIEADTEFRGLIDGGCTEDDGAGGTQTRYCIVRRTCSSCSSEPHRDIYYKRLAALPPMGTNSTAGEVYWLDNFMNNWGSYMNNMADGDFQLFSTYEDALAGTNAWTYCNYDNTNIGFPRECGPSGRVWNQWNSYVRGGGEADHHGFYVEKP